MSTGLFIFSLFTKRLIHRASFASELRVFPVTVITLIHGVFFIIRVIPDVLEFIDVIKRKKGPGGSILLSYF